MNEPFQNLLSTSVTFSQKDMIVQRYLIIWTEMEEKKNFIG